jgi:multidrug efflux system membrane fusion protein
MLEIGEPARRRAARDCGGLCAGAALVLLTAALACRSGGPAPGAEPVPVRVAEAAVRDVPIELHAIGNVEPIATVSLRAQVDGRVETIHFAEGQQVAEGDLLFSLDRRPLAAALQQARANLARDRAQASYAETQARSYRDLYGQGVASKQQYDQLEAAARVQAATVEADRAAALKAELDLSYATLRAPIAGRTGSLSVHPGDVVKANDTLMVVIHQLAPIYVSFAVPEQDLQEVRARMAERPLEVRAAADEPVGAPFQRGELSFVDNQVDRTTGTVRMKASFANQDRTLWPGEFVHVAIVLREEQGAVVVPSQAVQTGPQGPFVFVVRPDASVEVRAVTLGPTVGGESVVGDRLRPGERVVTDGQVRLVPGAKVQLREAAPAARAETAS